MINPLKVASAGYLKRQTKAVLIIAVAGYLNFQGTPPVPPIPPSGGGGSSLSHRHTYEEQREDERREKERREELFLIEFLKTATDIINNQ